MRIKNIPLSTKTFRILAFVEFIFIVALTYVGRPFQRSIHGLFQSSSQTFTPYLLPGSIVLVALSTLAGFRYFNKRRHLVIRVISIGLLFILGIFWLQPLAVELTHILLFGTLTIFILYSRLSQGIALQVMLAVLLANSVSLLDETLQGLNPERVFDTRDLLINFFGTVVGTVLWLEALGHGSGEKANE